MGNSIKKNRGPSNNNVSGYLKNTTDTLTGELSVTGNTNVGPVLNVGGIAGKVGEIDFFNSSVKIQRSLSSGLDFYTDGGIPQMSVLATGEVGIDNIAPEEKLHISNGNVLLDNNQSFKIKDNTGTPQQVFKLSGSNSIVVGNSSAGYITYQGGNTAGHIFKTGALQIMRLSSITGNVGIGENSPATILHINGAITQNPLTADPADPADGNSVQWVSDGTGSGDVGDVMMKINVGGVTKIITLIDYSQV